MESTVAHARLREVSPERYLQLAAASAISLYLIVLTGAAVRLTGSGLGCESWPGCQQTQFFPATNQHALIEFGNRTFAIFPLLLTLGVWLASLRTRGLPRWAIWLAAAAFLGTAAEAVLGLVTIRLDLHPLIVLTHFLLALLVLAAAIVVAVEAWGNARGRVESPVPRWLRLVGIVLVGACGILVATGTLSTAAGPHSGDKDEIDRFWNLLDAVWLHVRATAAFGIGFLLLLGWLVRHRRRARGLLNGAAVLLALLLIQMAVGEIQFRNQLPAWLVLVHVALAAAVWAWTVGLVAALWRTPKPLVRI